MLDRFEAFCYELVRIGLNLSEYVETEDLYVFWRFYYKYWILNQIWTSPNISAGIPQNSAELTSYPSGFEFLRKEKQQ